MAVFLVGVAFGAVLTWCVIAVVSCLLIDR